MDLFYFMLSISVTEYLPSWPKKSLRYIRRYLPVAPKGEGKMIVKKEDEATADLSKKIEFLELHIKGLDARIELLEQKLATLSNTQKKK